MRKQALADSTPRSPPREQADKQTKRRPIERWPATAFKPHRKGDGSENKNRADDLPTRCSNNIHTLVGNCPYFGRKLPTLCSIGVYTLLNECSLFGWQASTAHLNRSHASVIKRRKFADGRISPGRQRFMTRRLHTQQSPPTAERLPRLQTNRKFVRPHPYLGARPWVNPHAVEVYPPKPRRQQAGSGSPCVATQR